MDPKTKLEMIFMVAGGLGIFLLGMKNMSEGMQAIAGDRLRKLINAVTNNRLMACGVGAAITALIQSSSVTTVMVVGMVNASLMTLSQAIGVILGANIGTTITAWILVLKVGKYGLPVLGLAAFFYLFAKSDRVRYTASFFMGLGMVFFGLQLMKYGFAPIKDMPGFEQWFSRFTPENHFGVLKCCLAGAVLTAIIQSSSATLGITISLALTGVIDFPTAAALVLGENIGTTITALLASIGVSTNARRAALAHMFINIIGVVWITILFFPYIDYVEKITVSVENTFGWDHGEHIGRCIATTHTVFNVLNALFFMPFVGLLGILLCRIVPEKPHKEVARLTYLDVRMLDAPAIGIEQSQKEILRMSQRVNRMLSLLGEIVSTQKHDTEKEAKIFKRENILDLMQKEIVEFLGRLMSGNIAYDVVERGRMQLRMADEYESIGDYITAILKLNLKIRDTHEKISDQGLAELMDLHNHVADYVSFINQAVEQENAEIINKAQTQSQTVTHLMKEYRSSHLARVGTGSTTPLKSLIFTDMLNAYRRIKDHALNIAEVLAGEK